MSIKITPKQTKVNVTTTPKNRVTINTSGAGGIASNIDTLVELKDVDASVLANNETVVYDVDSGKFIIKVLPIISGGTF